MIMKTFCINLLSFLVFFFLFGCRGESLLSGAPLFPSRSISVGYFHAIAIKDGTLWAWGRNWTGQLGDGTKFDRLVPTQIGVSADWASVSAGDDHTIAIKVDGTLWAWGDNSYGRLGDGTSTSRWAPTKIGAASNWASISAGDRYTIATKTDGTLWAWGHNCEGQLGNGTIIDRLVPTKIGVDTDWASISAGFEHTIATKTDGTLWAWGYNGNGQLGDGTYIKRLVPTKIGVDTDWDSISGAGDNFTIATKTDGTLWAWGGNFLGQLGDGTIINRLVPTQIGVDTDWVSISAGARVFYTIATKTDGTLWLWGSSWRFGYINRLVPTKIGVGIDWASVSAGNDHTIAIQTDGTFWSWGSNSKAPTKMP